MNHFIQIHILSGQRSTLAGMLRVKELAYPSPPNRRTHNIPCRTTGHLEDITGTAEQKGGILRSSELWDGTPEFPKIERQSGREAALPSHTLEV